MLRDANKRRSVRSEVDTAVIIPSNNDNTITYAVYHDKSTDEPIHPYSGADEPIEPATSSANEQLVSPDPESVEDSTKKQQPMVKQKTLPSRPSEILRLEEVKSGDTLEDLTSLYTEGQLARKFFINAPSSFGYYKDSFSSSVDEFRHTMGKIVQERDDELKQKCEVILDVLQGKPTITPKERFQKAVKKIITAQNFFNNVTDLLDQKKTKVLTETHLRTKHKRICERTLYLSTYEGTEKISKKKAFLDAIKKKSKFLLNTSNFLTNYAEGIMESSFGSAAVSYFALLKRIILLNFLTSVIAIFMWAPIVHSSGFTTGIYLDQYNWTSILTGSGLEQTSLFLGYYTDAKVSYWSMRSSIFYTYFLITFVILVCLSIWLSESYLDTQSILTIRQNPSVYLANIVLCGWNFNIKSLHSINSEYSRLSIVLKESTTEITPSNEKTRVRLYNFLIKSFTCFQKQNIDNLYYMCLLLLRVGLWMVTIFLLLLGGSLIFVFAYQTFCDNYGLSYIYGFIPSIWHTILELLFTLITRLEFYKSKANEMLSLLTKHFLMRTISLLSIYVVIFSSYIYTRCPAQECCGKQNCFPNLCIGANQTTIISDCWETEVGKFFFSYLVAQLISSIIFRAILITAQKFVHITLSKILTCFKFIPKVITNLVDSLTDTPFHVPKHVIKIIYIQSLVWGGMLFCPFQTLIAMFGFIALYWLMFSVTYFSCHISTRQPRTARINLIYYVMLIGAFIWTMFIMHYLIFHFKPSQNCGPYNGTNSLYSFFPEQHLMFLQDIAINFCSEDSSCVNEFSFFVADFWNSPALGFLFIFLCLVIWLNFATNRKKNEEIILLKKQVIMLAADKVYYNRGNEHFLESLMKRFFNKETPSTPANNATKRSSISQTTLLSNIDEN